MAIDVELAGLKAAGTYRFERDLSTLPSGGATGAYSNLRLIVGFSKKGPFNSVQLITNSSQFIKLYGNIDRSLEKRGSYFHRSALVALSAGPILCLNLLSLDPNRDQVMHRSISANIKKSSKDICTIPYQTVFDTDKFWFLSSESYLDSVHKFDNDSSYDKKNNIINFTNVGNKPISVIVKKASEKNTKGYDVTLNDWFGAENVPEYFNGSSFVSDYMVEVYIIGGDFGPALKSNPNPYTDEDGTIPLEIYKASETEDNPYKRFASDIIYQEYFDKDGFKAEKLNKFLGLPSVNVIATYIGSLIPNFVNKLNQNMWIEDIINSDTLTTGLLCSVDVDMIEDATIDNESGFVDESIDIIGHNFEEVGGEYFNKEAINFLSYGFSDGRISELQGGDSDNESLTYIGYIKVHGDKKSENWFISDNGTPLNLDADNEIIMAKEDYKDDNKTSIKVGDLLLSYSTPSIETNKVFSRLTRVVEIKPLYNKNTDKNIEGEYVKDNDHIRIICSDIVKVEGTGKDATVKKYTTIDNICDRYHWTFLKGFKVSEESMPGGETDQERNNRQNKILNMISETNIHSNLYKALIDRDYIQWRYVVDTFGYGIENECKKVYALLCKGRQSGLALVNAPSMKDFKRSVEPSFVDSRGAVKSEYIACGGNLDKSPVNLFSLPKEENGASWAAYFYPYLKISDLAAVKTVPPAAYVSNLYIAKYSASKPWSIVAGPKRGVISGNQVIGVEGTLIHDDREYLEPMGINPIVWENGVGVEIFANKTAKQTPVSALSSIHAREACVYIQDNVEAILKKYNWEANTARNREEIKTLVDAFLLNVKDGDGIYDFKTVMDATNNTTEVIDRNMGVIDIYIEVVRGLEILAQRLTVLKTGSIESGNFE
jgi:hypothetical protein